MKLHLGEYMYSLIIQHNSLITINVCICVYAHLHRDTMSVHIDLCDIFTRKLGKGVIDASVSSTGGHDWG